VEWPAAAGIRGTEPLRLEFELAGGNSRIIKVTSPEAARKTIAKIGSKWLKK